MIKQARIGVARPSRVSDSPCVMLLQVQEVMRTVLLDERRFRINFTPIGAGGGQTIQERTVARTRIKKRILRAKLWREVLDDFLGILRLGVNLVVRCGPLLREDRRFRRGCRRRFRARRGGLLMRLCGSRGAARAPPPATRPCGRGWLPVQPPAPRQDQERGPAS